MQLRQIGKTGIGVTEIAFGCSAIGNLYRKVTDAEAEAVLTAAWEAGIRYFDVAPFYGRGLAEERLRAFLRGRPRAEWVVSTKVGRVLSPSVPIAEADGFVEPSPNNVHYDYSARGIIESLEQSCVRLGTNRIDIVYVHDIGTRNHGAANQAHMRDLLGSGFEQLASLKEAGRIGAIGLGVNEVEVCLELMDRVHLDVILLAGRLTLLDRSAEAELVPRCLETGTSLVLGGIFNSGILASGPVEGAMFDYRPAPQDILERVRDMQSRAAAAGLSLPTAALHFVHRHPGVSSILIGTADPTVLQENMRALGQELPDGIESLFD